MQNKNKNRNITAYKYLSEAIVSNLLKPGDPITEQQISDTLGISRTPIREALKKLEAEGLVRHIPGRGSFVSEVTVQDIEEIFSLRVALEILALQIAYNKISDDELQELENSILQLDTNSSADDFYKYDRLLHHVIVHNGDNRRLENFLNNINIQIERVRIISSLLPQRLDKSKEEHLAIVRALKDRDLLKTEHLLKTHINNVRESAMEACRKMYYR